jgi:S-adenosylmethionine:tRNA ribosyltransferase-isomerase
MVARRGHHDLDHHTFAELPKLLEPGDVLVVNTSATVPSAFDARGSDGAEIRVHLASPTPEGLWLLETRRPDDRGGTRPALDLRPQRLTLPEGATVSLLTRSETSPRLWLARLDGIADLPRYRELHGSPIRYLPGPELPITDYQTVFAAEPGSAEMPSAGRPFTTGLVTELVSAGVVVLPVTLHTGISSFEADETPGPERFRVPAVTASLINEAKREGGRLVAVGTTVVRALETTADRHGRAHPGDGVTDLVIDQGRGMRLVDGLLTGWHEPESSHLRLLEAMAGAEFLSAIYRAAAASGYLWHEFGDELLILP